MADFIGLNDLYSHSAVQTPHDFNAGAGHFNILRVEDLELKRPRSHSKYNRRSFFKVSLVTGNSVIHYADRSVVVNGTVLVFTNPMLPYHWETISDAQTGFICVFTEAFFNGFGNVKELPVFHSAANAILPLLPEQATFFTTLFGKMFDDLQGEYTYKYDLLRSLLLACIHEAQKLQPALGEPLVPANASARIATLFEELLERQFPLDVPNQTLLLRAPSDFAYRLNVHVNHLNKALKEVTGKTTSQHIAARVVQEACVLLRMTDNTVAEIAWMLGFDEPNHFSGFFKNRTKMSPLKFRQLSVD